jgi:hypothetical protein
VLVIDDGVLAGHVAVALAAHVAELRRQGYSSDWRALLELRDACIEANRGGQSRPSGGPGFCVVETLPVREIEVFEAPAFVDYATAGRMLGCSERTVRRRVREGALPVGGPSKRAMLAVVDVEAYKRSLRSSGVSVGAPGRSLPGPATDSTEGPLAGGASVAVPPIPPADGFPSSGYATAGGRTLGDAMRNLGAVERERQMWWRDR